MRNMPSERGRPGGGGFLQVAQVDIDDHDSDRTERRRLSGRERFRGTVQQVLRQTSFAASHNANLPSVQSSPASSDSTLTDEDYLSLPIQQFDEVDLIDDHDRYAEVVDSYGPEAVDNNATPSPSYSTKAGKGLEVRVESYPLALSPGGLYTDDRLRDFSYRGSEEIIEKSLPTPSSLYNYRPVPLRRLFILILFCGLIAFLALSQLALRLLPDASNMGETLPAFQNITEIRKRSALHHGGAGNQRYFKYSNSTQTSVSTGVQSTTRSGSSTEVGSTSEVESQPTSSTQPSATQSNTPTGSSPTTELEGQPTSPVQLPATETMTSTTEVQNDQSSTTKIQVTDVTATENNPGATTTLSLTQPEEHKPTTGQDTANPTPNDPGPNDDSSSNEFTSSTQTKPEAMLTDNHQTLPGLSPPQDTAATTVDSLHGTTDGKLSQPTVLNPSLGPTGAGEQQAGDSPPSQSSSKPTGVNLPDSPYPSSNQSTDEPTDDAKFQAADQQTELPNNGGIGSSSPTIHIVLFAVTSSQILPSVAGTKTTTTSGIKINTSKNILAQANSLPNPTQLPGLPEQSAADDNKPFTTITMTQTTETPPPPITTVFTTSISITEGSFIEVTMTTIIFGHIKIADPLTDYIVTTTYANGTVSTISKEVYDMVLTSIKFDATGKPETEYAHILKSAQETTLRDPQGFPTATLSYYDVESIITLYNSNNLATATVTTTIPETTVLSTLYNTNGIPTKTTTLFRPIPTDIVIVRQTPTSSPSPNDQGTLKLRRLPDGIYFAGLMLPTLLAIFISIPIRILNRNVKLYQGFHALASDRGASAAESLCLKTTGPASFINGLWSLQSGQRLLGLTSVLMILSALTIPFSAEVFRLVLQGPQCHSNEANKLECSVVLGVFPVPAQVLSALLILLITGIILVALLLRRWTTGVKHNPWNILDMSQLAASTDMHRILERLRWHRKAGHKVDTKEFANKLQAKIFGLREGEENGAMKYSVHILIQELDYATENPLKKAGRSVAFIDPEDVRRQPCLHWPSEDFVPFFMLSWTGRILFLLLLSGGLIAVLTYNIVARGSEYQRGLTGKAVGVRFLFSGAGVLVTFAWGSLFNAVSFLSPYMLLKRRRLNKGQAINISPAMNPFTGLWLAFVPSRRDLYLGVVAGTAILSEVLPLFLGNIPCNGVQVDSAETVSVYLSVAVLSIMIIIVGASFFIDWPSTMGADPSTVVGAMYAAHVFSMGRPLGRFFKKEAPGMV